MQKRLAVLSGPNLNLLGCREPGIYGTTTLSDIETRLHVVAKEEGVELVAFQSNHEGALIDFIQGLMGQCDGIVINPGGLTHSSVSLRDALLGSGIPFVEVHLSNTYARESFRHKSLFSDVAQGVIIGLGPLSYELAVLALIRRMC